MSAPGGRTVLWFRRDLRLGDNPALLAARAAAAEVVPVFVVDPALWGPAGAVRRAHLLRSLHALQADMGGPVTLVHGDPVARVVEVARRAGASEVHVAADFGPYGRERDRAVEEALAAHGVALVRTGSPYAVPPGTLWTQAGGPYRLFTPFLRAWAAHGWPQRVGRPRRVRWSSAVPTEPWPASPEPEVPDLPEAGERAALTRWRRWRDTRLSAYADRRDRPDLDATSRMSAALRWGEVHPRTLLADVADHGGEGATALRGELAWREFAADVLWHLPHTARDYQRPVMRGLGYVTGRLLSERLTAWASGRTGYPLVDAGMRQLLAEGWMHNRVRMVVASFLVKDLRVEWTHGARHFMGHLVDGDLASNSLNWQWVAGTGTDSAPYLRVFNPVAQARRFDPDGRYVRRYVPELADVRGTAVHEPWTLPGGVPHGYAARLVDHHEARAEALEAYAALRSR